MGASHKGSDTTLFVNDGGELRVPGHGHPFQFELNSEHCFNHGINEFRALRLTARELAMLNLMNTITDKPGWEVKVFDEVIVDKWRSESKHLHLISEAAFNWCITELRDKAVTYKGRGLLRTFDSNAHIVKTEKLIHSGLQSRLRAAVQPLLDNPVKDWHPNTNETVLDLVHPSMYPMMWGKTPILPRGTVDLQDVMVPCDLRVQSTGEDEAERAKYHYRLWSSRYQWLPAEVEFTATSTPENPKVRFTSYINNLHPEKHRHLYNVIEDIMCAVMPAWDDVLVYGHRHRSPLRIFTDGARYVKTEEPEWFRHLPNDPEDEGWDEAKQRVQDYLSLLEPNYEASTRTATEVPEEYKDNKERGLLLAAAWKFDRLRTVEHPEPAPAQLFPLWKTGDDGRHLEKQDEYTLISALEHDHEVPCPSIVNPGDTKGGLQVIVKLASVELTPDKPQHPGGNWHLEGMINEHIVATAIYYYDVQNVTQSRLRFRQETEFELDGQDLKYDQHEHVPLAEVFGARTMQGEPAVQEVGSVLTFEGRLLVFPNTYQHRVEPFELVDKKKSGHRRMLVLWLVDPHYRILSTRNVPPQQADWWLEKLRSATSMEDRLPGELQVMVDKEVMKGTMTYKEACDVRLEVMQERSSVETSLTEYYRETYNLCEH